jgi:hypothetical protein
MHQPWFFHCRQGLLVFGTLALLTVSVAGPMHVAVMPMDEHSQQIGCPLMLDQAALCPMNFTAHLALWRSGFIAVLPVVMAGLVVVLAGWLIGGRLAFLRAALVFHLKKRFILQFRSHTRATLSAPALQPIRWALATGVLHPKIFPALFI